MNRFVAVCLGVALTGTAAAASVFPPGLYGVQSSDDPEGTWLFQITPETGAAT